MVLSAAPMNAQDSAAQSTIVAQNPVLDLNSHRYRGTVAEDVYSLESNRRRTVNDLGNIEAEARLEATRGHRIVPFKSNLLKDVRVIAAHPAARLSSINRKSERREKNEPGGNRAARKGLKKPKNGKQALMEMPPTPLGCEWRQSDQGWNLWRCWSERDQLTNERIKKSRYAGYISNQAWGVMKDYDYETFISIIGQRLRRYGKR